MSKFDEFIICKPFSKVKAFEVQVSEENLNYILLLKKGITVLGNVKVSILRELFCIFLADWAEALTEANKGKHFIGDFLPPDELERFMETFRVSQSYRNPFFWFLEIYDIDLGFHFSAGYTL